MEHYNKQQTAVEWLQYLYENRPESTLVEQDFEQAKQMEIKQNMSNFDRGFNDGYEQGYDEGRASN